MSKEDRMDRARRIRRMREGRRDSAETDEIERVEGENQTGAAGADEAALDAVDDAVAAALERVSGASAPVPSPEEMSGSAPTAPDEMTSPADEEHSTGHSAEESATEGPRAPTRRDESADVGRTDPETRVLEFTLGDEQYCLDIEYVEEIVDDEQITRVPNTPEYVEGVVDLRGQITTILNPKVVMERDDPTRGELLVIFDGEAFEDQGRLGWVVDDVRQVSPVSDEEVNDPPMDDDYLNGIIDRKDDDELVIWTTPDLVLDEAT